jgi:pimeloyl-ACP methyl ester carboxylesterase
VVQRPDRLVLGVLLATASLVGCSSEPAPRPGVEASPDAGLVDVGGYGLWHECVGTGSPTVILDAGLGAAGSSEWPALIDALAVVHTRVCTYDRAGNGLSDPRPTDHPTAADEADELERLLEGAHIAPPYVLVPHSFAGLVAREFADRYPGQVAGFVFEDVSTAWEIDLWPRWDPSPWIDGDQRVDIDATERDVLAAARLGDRPTIVVSQTAYDEEGIPRWAGPIFAKQQDRLAALGDDVIHVRVEHTGHFIHREHPEVMVDAIAAVVGAVRGGSILPRCPAVFVQSYVDCVSGP